MGDTDMGNSLLQQKKINVVFVRKVEPCGEPEAESKEKHGVWDPMPVLTITTSPYVHCRVQSTLPTHLPWAWVTLCQSLYLNLMPESILFPSQGLGIWPLVEALLFCRQGTDTRIKPISQGEWSLGHFRERDIK